MLKKLSWFLVMVVGILGLVGFGEHSSAAELNNGGFVDSIQFDKTELMDGELTSIHVTFSEKSDTKLKAGDTLTLSLPKELEGLTDSNDAPREIDLNGLGIVRVYKDKVICTFNEKVNQLERVRGEFTFGVRVTNVEENTVKEVPVNLGTSVSVQNIVVKGQTGIYEEVEKPFFYKTGDLLGKSGQIRWFLSANLNKSDLANDIVMKDKSGGGQLLNKDSFTFTIDNYLGQSTLSLEEFQNQGYGTVEFGAENEFVIRLYRSKARLASFTIMYTATITDAGKKQANFTNDCQIDYQILYQKPINEQATHQVKNIFLDGNAIGDENQSIKEAIEQEETIEDESNELEEIAPLDPEEQAKESQEEELNKAKEDQPEVKVDEQEEVIEEETKGLEKIKPIKPEIVEITEIPELETKITGTKVDVQRDNQTKTTLQIDNNIPSNHEVNGQSQKSKLLLSNDKDNTTQSKAQLPKAGSKNSIMLMIAGFVVILLAFAAYTIKRKNM
uniref:Gram-positive cocci surface proteins LPxTG domain-containing protein n=1 Tax=Candidatus Enterococcus mansonii TaxID=1834181 RepID=A0A242CG64_9ENTE|nr:collagen binding domain-containing protein [Enterococcus sp. 4G2_DIV0659]OTO08772.1 hypothetical protein A5880_001772 [Enterococcus sp. 4G2_DIV0659]